MKLYYVAHERTTARIRREGFRDTTLQLDSRKMKGVPLAARPLYRGSRVSLRNLPQGLDHIAVRLQDDWVRPYEYRKGRWCIPASRLNWFLRA